MNKHGIVFTRPRDTISFFIGVFLALVGLVPLLSALGLVSWSLPGFLTNLIAAIAIWVIAVAGLYVVIDGFIEPPAHNLHWFLIIGGIVFFVVGLLPILHTFGVIGFSIPFVGNPIVYQSLITIEGILLIVGGLTEH
jgi:hypothetical protein